MMKHLLYLSYVIRHKWFVMLACWSEGLYWQGITHDLSKFSPSEWFAYAEYFYGNLIPRSELAGDFRYTYIKTKEWHQDRFDLAWLSHQHQNNHHWQNWILREDDGETKALPMSPKARLEMVCDWRGAGRAQGHGNQWSQTLGWYSTNQHRIILHPDTREWVERFLDSK